MNMRPRLQLTVPILLFSLVSTSGCTDSPTHGTVRGTVTLDDEPLAEGTVRFVPVDGQSQTTSGFVTNGTFTATVPAGLMRVEFSAPKVTGEMQKMYDEPDSPEVPVVDELLPVKYNVETELTLEVKLGSQDASFPLVSE